MCPSWKQQWNTETWVTDKPGMYSHYTYCGDSHTTAIKCRNIAVAAAVTSDAEWKQVQQRRWATLPYKMHYTIGYTWLKKAPELCTPAEQSRAEQSREWGCVCVHYQPAPQYNLLIKLGSDETDGKLKTTIECRLTWNKISALLSRSQRRQELSKL